LQDWNPFLKRLICDYLQETDQANITIRIDDIEVNTPYEKVYDMAELLQYDSGGHVVYGVIPSGTWRGGDPEIFDVSVNTIFKIYWWFYVIAAFFPLSFFVLWTFMSKGCKDDQGDDPPPNDPDPEERQSVSIIIPAYNEEKNIGKCLEAILRQDFGGEMEIIVINDGSTDKTAEIASRYSVTLIDLQINLGKANALNTGIKNANGDILIFSDSDSQMSGNAVSSLVRCLKDRQDVQVGAGNVLIDDRDGKSSLIKYFQMIEYHTEQEINRYLQSQSGKVLVCPGPLFAVRRQVTEEILFSDQSVVEDADFTVHVLKKTMKVVREPEAKVYTEAPDSIRKWFIQRKRWWYGNLQLWKIHNHWAKRNPWMILNYLGFITSTCSLVLLLLLPYFILTYDDIMMILIRGMAYVATPVILFILLVGPFFRRERKLMIMLLPYILLYATMKAVVTSYLYIRYLSGRGVRIKFGPRNIEVR
jgi:cellulose synthase/poly-beta-1,6-N-acetylglucosamine synthase-like glycosyltransferase